MSVRKLCAMIALLLCATSAYADGGPASLAVPILYYKLPNGLRVSLSRDSAAPIVVTSVCYRAGFRYEPMGRTGLAHLLEHLVFRGSLHSGQLEQDKAGGAFIDAGVRFDVTNYYEILPAYALESALWAEADRMRMGAAAITAERVKAEQQAVVNELNTLLNRPYGGSPSLFIPRYVYTNRRNAHDYGDENAGVTATTVDELRSFFRSHYVPNNAALSIVGDFDPEQAKALVKKHFGSIPARKLPPPADLAEPSQRVEKRVSRRDARATRPALAFAYHMPPRKSPEYHAMALLDQILVQGQDSFLYEELVKKRRFSESISGGINIDEGDMFDSSGPTLWKVSLVHNPSVRADEIVAAVDGVIERLRFARLDSELLGQAVTKLRSYLYGFVGQFGGLGQAFLMNYFALFDDDPRRLNSLESELRKVTPALITRTVRRYLQPANRTILTIEPDTVKEGK